MVSGQGLFSSKGRCYPAFVDYMKCYNSQVYPQDYCQSQLEEYFECLHHRKEKARLVALIRELESQQEQAKEQEISSSAFKSDTISR